MFACQGKVVTCIGIEASLDAFLRSQVNHVGKGCDVLVACKHGIDEVGAAPNCAICLHPWHLLIYALLLARLLGVYKL